MKYTSKDKFKELWSERLMSAAEREAFKKKEKENADLMKIYKSNGSTRKRQFERSRQGSA